MKRTASAVWNGGLKDGKGTISTQSGVLNKTQYGFRTRFEDGVGTNPEELIGAAHAGCFSMALAAKLEAAGLKADNIRTWAAVSLDAVDGGYAINSIHLDLVASVPGATPEDFERIARQAKDECPVSRVLNASITLAVKLEK